MQFNNILRQLREEEGISQAQLAKRLNISQATVSQWEAGTRMPGADAVKTLSHYFDTSADFLLGIVDEKLKLVPYYKDITEEEKLLLQAFSQLRPCQKTAIAELIKTMLV